jgi:hypothetical protein
MTRILPLAAFAALLPVAVRGQAVSPEALAPPAAADVESIEAIVDAVYGSIQRAPGEGYDWDRFLSLFLPTAMLIPNAEQAGGGFVVHSPESFMTLVDSLTVVGGANDRGFAEEQIAARTERYGDVAHVFSTYQKHFWADTEILGRGINSIQLVWSGGRWWVASIVWDEEVGAGPLPDRYLP